MKNVTITVKSEQEKFESIINIEFEKDYMNVECKFDPPIEPNKESYVAAVSMSIIEMLSEN